MSVRVEKLEFEYEDFSLRIENLQFESSRITSIVGPNGSGKTTFLKCIGGLLPIKKKSIFIDGQDISEMKGNKRARLIGYVPQEHGSLFNFSARDFVLMGRAPYHSPFSLPSDKDIQIAEEALEFVGLAAQSEKPYFYFSSGERRLVLIARSLAQRTDLLLLDEPTTFLDPKHEIEIMELVKKLAEEKKKTILITLHSLELALQYSDDMVFMKTGRVFAFGKPEEILTESLLKNIYDIEMKIVGYDGKKFILRSLSAKKN